MSPIDLRLGRWQECLADVEMVDAVITDPPYTSRVEFGYRSGSMIKRGITKAIIKPTIPYAAITESDAREFAESWCSRARKWIVAFNDHIGWRWLAEAIEAQGWYVFAPVVWVRPNSTPRFQGDGPADSCEYLVIARPRVRTKVGSLPGYYINNIVNGFTGSESLGLVGQKPLDLMRALVRDYTASGDLIAEPFAGTGTTCVAAAAEGRRCVAAEMSAENYAKARLRLARGYTPNMFAGVGT